MLKNYKNMLIVALLSSLMLQGCNKNQSDITSPQIIAYQEIIEDMSEREEEVVNEDKPSIVCWGDSMMTGFGTDEGYIVTQKGTTDISYITTPSALEKLTGLTTYNFGCCGEASTQIAARAGGNILTVNKNVRIKVGKTSLVTILDENGEIYESEDYGGYGDLETEYTNQMYVDGYLCHVSNSKKPGLVKIKLDEQYSKDGINEIRVKAGTVVIPRAIYDHSNDIFVIEMGSNGGWDGDYDELVRQYKAILENNHCEQFIIVGDTDDPGTSLGDLFQGPRDENGQYVGLRETMWEKTFREAFGEHFFNTRLYMLKNGLEICGLNATASDNKDRKKGFISDQLKSDWTHFNACGYYAKAVGIYEKGVQLGYW